MEIYYVNGAGDKIILSEWPIAVTDLTQLFGRSWDISVTTNKSKNRSRIDNVYRTSKEMQISISIYADDAEEYTEIMNNFEDVTGYDLTNGSPGKLYVGDYYLQCFIRDTEPSDYEELFYTVDEQLTIYSARPYWIKETMYSLNSLTIQQSGDEDASTMDFPYDYEYEYYASYGKVKIDNPSVGSSNFEMYIYGYAENPSITIGGNKYELEATIEEGAYVKINSYENTVVMVDKYGNETNIYNLRAKENSIFNLIEAGSQVVYWSQGYGIDIILFDERSEPKWSS